ncbi:hypothetical protein OAU50_01075 [Planctomycetota bacterium]|nr:hypothetical protein [Planctomycetota bacterium]
MNPGFGIGASTATMPEEQRKAVEAAIKPMMEETFSSPIFWTSIILGTLVAAYSIFVGIRLLKSKAGSWRLAVIRAGLVVFVLMPLELWQGAIQSKHMAKMQEAMMTSTGSGTPPPDFVGDIMSATMWGALVATAIVTIAINVVLLITITRPAVREFLDSGAGENDVAGYNPHMGMVGPPPNQPPVQPPNQPPPQI